MLRHLVILVSLVLQISLAVPTQVKAKQADEFSLTSTHTEVAVPYTKNITIRCASTADGDSQFSHVSEMTIEKQNSEEKWETMARITGSDLKNPLHIKAEGKIADNVRESFLNITWPFATKASTGAYRCDVSGKNEELDPINERTSSLTIKERALTAFDVFSLLNEQKKKAAEDLSDIKGDIEDLKGAKTNVTELKGRLAKVEEKLENTDRRVQSLEDDFYSGWPQGSYSLLTTDSGCPQAPAFIFGKKIYYCINAESYPTSSQRTKTSHSIHLSKPILTQSSGRNFVYLRFCSALTDTRTRFWPAGSYCINQYSGKSCPIGLTSGYARIYEERSRGISRAKDYTGSSGYTLLGDSSHYTDIPFCCIKGASNEEGIRLPTHSPFYLYRFGGSCQKVIGMSVTEEYISIDIDDYYRTISKSGMTPDIDFVDEGVGYTRIILCYYS